CSTMLEQLGLIGTIRDEEQSPEEPDTESEHEVSLCSRLSRVNVSELLSRLDSHFLP
ncbi:unnamed protein product, partial [Tetraodon nigroviridis]